MLHEFLVSYRRILNKLWHTRIVCNVICLCFLLCFHQRLEGEVKSNTKKLSLPTPLAKVPALGPMSAVALGAALDTEHRYVHEITHQMDMNSITQNKLGQTHN